MLRLAAAGFLTALLIAGCGGSGSRQTQKAATTTRTAPTPAPGGGPTPAPRVTPIHKGDEAVIRGWNKAVDAGDYGRAATFFAPKAVVIQGYALPLLTHRDATVWNSGLPCRADITSIHGEGDMTVAAFHLREGPGHRCTEGGDAQVSFTIRHGLIILWRQLPQDDGGTSGGGGAPV
jgi:hypothetical protein